MIHLTSKKTWCFLLAFLFQLAAFVMLAMDPTPQGFGILSLWLAPILFIIGLLLPITGLARKKSLKHVIIFNGNAWQTAGFLLSAATAFGTYLITLEPTASLWDCSEAIAAAYKLQVPHTPGTPLTLLLGRLFSMLAFGNVHQVARWINMLSAVTSALAVGLLFLIIWHFGQRHSSSHPARFIGSLGGALCLAFSDTFWYSAVEAETYAPSVCFMLLQIWLALRLTSLEGRDRTNRILLISYLTGLSYCIHPMCILILPVCFLIGRAETDWKRLLWSFALGVICILFISKVIAVYLFEWAFQLDLFLVNQMAFPFYSGVIVLLAVTTGTVFLLWKKYPATRIAVLSIALVICGFSPYMMLFIRSAHQPSINEFTPDNLAQIKPYMNRESYPGRPLVFGPYFDAHIDDVFTKTQAYIQQDNQYVAVGNVPEYHYEKDRQTIFPRLYSSEPAHIKTYRQWTGLSDNQLPRFSDNLRFMFQYQLNYMYTRYLLWNFAGRRSDIQYADWLRPWEGTGDRSPISYNRAYNQYFLIPLLLGLMGLFVQAKRDRNGFAANLSFFLITGLLLAVYLNGTPNEPRERDYIYVGSYVAFSIWIGLGMIASGDFLRNQKAPFVPLLLLSIPVWMFYQNLDDHDRSGRTLQMDYARGILSSCDKDAILFTGGDNDTFPLWYLQEVEGFRTDVRVEVLSYFNADWYINQLSRPYYDSPPVTLTLKTNDSQYGPYDPVYVQERFDKPISWGKYMTALNAHNPQLLVKNGDNDLYILPSRNLEIPTSEGSLQIHVTGSYLPKSEMAILDIIHSNDWKRSIHFNFTSINSLSINLKEYVVDEGLVYRLKSQRNAPGEIPVDLEKSYKNLMTKVDYSNLADPAIYFNHEDFQLRIINPLRFAFNDLIESFLRNGDESKAVELALFAYHHLYAAHLESSYANVQLSHLLTLLQQSEAADSLLRQTFDYYDQTVRDQLKRNEKPARNDLGILQETVRQLDDPVHTDQFQRLLEQLP